MSASKLTIIVVVLLHLIAFGLAVAAERRRSIGKRTSDEYDERDYCVYDSDIASWYGTGAFIFLLFSQALVMATTRCLCCGRALRPGGHRSCSIVLFLFSWRLIKPDWHRQDCATYDKPSHRCQPMFSVVAEWKEHPEIRQRRSSVSDLVRVLDKRARITTIVLKDRYQPGLFWSMQNLEMNPPRVSSYMSPLILLMD